MDAPAIRAKVMCVLRHGDRILASRGFDDVKKEDFHRVLGGTMNFGERAEDAIRREIKEELQSDLTDLRLLDVVESIYTYRGAPGHQIVFLFEGVLTRTDLQEKPEIHIVEDTYEFDAEWVPVAEILSKKRTLYPAVDWSKYLNI
jgi:ADP-ribose pyrophosphatase YjhB (NUDIX family)